MPEGGWRFRTGSYSQEKMKGGKEIFTLEVNSKLKNRKAKPTKNNRNPFLVLGELINEN